MSGQRRRAQQRPASPGARVGVREADPGGGDAEEVLCSCCEPRNPHVMRPDLGTLGDGSAEYALCVLHEPQPVVYRNRGDGIYAQATHLSLNSAGELVDRAGNIIAQVAGDSFQRLSTVDDDDADPGPQGRPDGPGPAGAPSPGGAARPASYHVDLSQDDFYR